MRKADTVTPRFRVAIHESGHCVVANALEIPTPRLQLYKTQDFSVERLIPGRQLYKVQHIYGGRCYHNSDDAKLEDVGAALLAGDLAELHHFNERYSDSRSDEDDFYRLCLTELQRRGALWKAQRLVAQHADRIWRVAKVLDLSGDMDETRLSKVLEWI